MWQTRALSKKTGNVKRIFHARTDIIKDRNIKDLREAEEIKRWQEYIELHKKGLNDLDNHGDVVIPLELDLWSENSSRL